MPAHFKETTMVSNAEFSDHATLSNRYRVSSAALPPPAVLPAPGTGRLAPYITIGDVRLPEGRVRVRATELAQRARARGAGHSLRVWRDAHYHALVQLAREAGGLAAEVRCLTLTWQSAGDAYYVSATFDLLEPVIH
jgi:hypothetical protein